MNIEDNQRLLSVKLYIKSSYNESECLYKLCLDIIFEFLGTNVSALM